MGNKNSTPSNNSISLEDLYSHIYDSLNKANQTVNNNKIDNIQTFFYKDNDNVYIPKNIKVKVNEDIIEVPLITLIQHNDLKIDSMEISLNTEFTTDCSRNIFSKLINKGKERNIKLIIKSNEPSENLSRIISSLNI